MAAPQAERDVVTAARTLLDSWKSSASTAGPDPGPAVLAALVADPEAGRTWLRGAVRAAAGTGLFTGLGGVVAGLRLIPGADSAAERAEAVLGQAAAHRRWRTTAVGFADYDLVSGPSGTLLAHFAGSTPVSTDRLAPFTGHLTALADAHLSGLRIGAHSGHPLLGWSQDEILTGLAHGAAGPLAALSLAGAEPDAIRNLAAWLAARTTTDSRGILTWSPRGRGKPGRQGWCYGTPGVSWALWTAGRALGRAGAEFREIGLAAMGTLCAKYDPDTHLDGLGVCHGAAGMLLVADAFARQAGSTPAAELRDWLRDHLHTRLDEVLRMGGTGLLSGAAGVLAALLTADGRDRSWLPCLALS
ncbi:lanthionine synthetase LanC family protein [Saccharothrix sp.]|uniref:lanthionine synthetase LanC family protein n=1 Tax=Saccharothrix sp. TaxID=1873460 RepID=UPI002811DCDB|nr:lanthionine synthetase LanC family protein [Saccharothrix sp.]